MILVTTVGTACGSDRTGGPRGEPSAVVGAAPDRTVAAGRARFEASAPGAVRSGEVDFEGSGPAGDQPPTGEHPELDDPRAMVDLVRGALAVESYGGALVRGASTFRYEAVINVERAVVEAPAARRAAMEAFARRLGVPAFYADIWVDGEGRLRRVQLPLEKTTERPEARSKRIPEFVTVDFFGFPEG
ncbi:MAG: hypothetical protein ACRD0N_04905 [Acidimicrobiales bacterium]